MAIETSDEPRNFTDFEHRGWQANSQGYVEHWGRLVRQTVAPTLDAAAVGSGLPVVDICCGPGTLTGEIVRRGASAVGVDFSTEALALARENVPAADFRTGDAAALPFEDATFDAAVSGYGLMHVADPAAVLREMYRVVRPGGRIAVSVWEKPGPGNAFGVFFGAMKAHADLDVDLPHGPDFFQFGDPDRMTAGLQTIGLADVRASRVEQVWSWDDPLGIVRAVLEGAVRARALLLAQSEATRAAIDAAVADGMAAYRTPDGDYRMPMPAIVGSGMKPPA
jgi:SAM-dependent methyltransferase